MDSKTFGKIAILSKNNPNKVVNNLPIDSMEHKFTIGRYDPHVPC